MSITTETGREIRPVFSTLVGCEDCEEVRPVSPIANVDTISEQILEEVQGASAMTDSYLVKMVVRKTIAAINAGEVLND